MSTPYRTLSFRMHRSTICHAQERRPVARELPLRGKRKLCAEVTLHTRVHNTF